ncbi:type II toxin-antitoxin system VapC family toxin [Microbacterium murale]|uniref:Twitching motility protein PilT n=1 Tax=Microbacterium murale TaxID=1081040 RepID=A0ABQ1RK38_9MICO|nr:type II toxin-antitoxin system VapC family toxin [Microbacterium murale]GGD72449.1 twitching motility protein PilT [Microbacterium murale]
MLLDTNALIWLVHDSPRLGQASRRSIDAATQVHYSSVSVTEITIKHMLGRMSLPGGETFPEIFRSSGLTELPLLASHARTLLGFESLARHDPFDRLLLAQAKQERFTFLTSDATLLALDEDWISDARL